MKTNLGHLEAAAGIAGLVKTVLALHHGAVPKQLHFSAPSPHIDFEANALRVVTEAEPWPRYSGTATAGVSAFGFGGTNAHVLVQEYRQSASPDQPAPTQTHAADAEPEPALFVLDAPSEDRLREQATQLADWLRGEPGRYTKPVDAAHTLLGRTGKGLRQAAVVARTSEQAAEALTHLAEGNPHPGRPSSARFAPAQWAPSGCSPGTARSGRGRLVASSIPNRRSPPRSTGSNR